MVRICVLCDSRLKSYQREALRYALEHTDAELSLVVVNQDSDHEDESNRERGFQLFSTFLEMYRETGWWVLVQTERWLAKRLGLRRTSRTYQGSIDVRDVPEFEDVDTVECSPILVDGGPWRELPVDVVDRIAEECDVVTRFGFGLIKGAVLTAPRYGVLSFHPANIGKIRGLGTSVAFYQGNRTAGMSLQRLNDSIDGGELIALEEVDITDLYTLEDVLIRQRKSQGPLLSEGIQKVSDPAFESTVPVELGPYYPVSTKESFGFAVTIATKNFVGRFLKLVKNTTENSGDGED